LIRAIRVIGGSSCRGFLQVVQQIAAERDGGEVNEPGAY
jgi:hypothetical protein